jgi:PAS domain S-box-containing protein
MGPGRFSVPRLSVKHRLPLLIGTLLLGIITASTWASYRGVKESALEVGAERLQNFTQQLANRSQQSTALLLSKTFTVANDPAIRTFLESPSPATKAGASAILQQFAEPQDPNGVQVELWDAKHTLVLIVPDGASPEPSDLDKDFKQCDHDPFKSTGTLRIVKDLVVYPALAATRDEAGKPIGYLVRWRRISAASDPRRLRDLLGSEASLYFGNSQGDVWTDLAKPVPKPPSEPGSTLQVVHYKRDGDSVMALGRPVAGTPFFIVVEFPDRLFVAQANRFLRRIALVDLVLLGIGVMGTLLVSRNITRPLNMLTKSAAGISTGDYSGMAHIRRNDELGALSNAFTAMVTRLRDSQLDLERNIRELKDTQEETSKLAAIVESSNDAIIGKTWDGTITSWNKGAEKLYGYSAEEAVGRSGEILFPPENRDEIGAIQERLNRGESLDPFETVRISRDGKRIPVFLTISPIRDESGAISGFSTIARDITERKLAEEEVLRTNQRLEGTLAELQMKTQELASMTQQLWQASKLATMGELAASVAHELNNPLATLALHAESLLDQLPAGDPKRRSVEVIDQEVERMASLVSNLLLFSRRSHQQISTVNLGEELHNSLDFINYHLRSHKINAATDFPNDLPNVQADRQQLRQVFLNLLTNASDAMPDGGTLTLRARRGILENGASAVVIEFSDTGIGIEPKDLPKLWEPFFTTKPEGKGTGLGLAICRRTVEEHRGTIEIESTPGKGTTVRIILPSTELETGKRD